jgi:long-chain acyl-CoA synthetase
MAAARPDGRRVREENEMAGAKPFPAVSLAEVNAALTRTGAPFEIEERIIHGVRTRVWKNAPPTLRDAFLLGRAYGERTFVVYRDERASYEAFARAALAVAAALQEAGVGKGDRVAIAMRNLPEWPVAFFGCLLAGGVATLLNAWWTGPELEYGLVDSGAKVAIVDRERRPGRASAQLCRPQARLRQPRGRGGAPKGRKARLHHRRRQFMAASAG